ncbi:hypothetical protein T190115A13A_70086 [Tenacibaculum sp. 190524A02b]|uniref:Uncharacterized protein n=1 Tax=Tenacibaculum vairaonense TaxID=3137860 RepID=A0ABP1FD85_9FLAO
MEKMVRYKRKAKLYISFNKINTKNKEDEKNTNNASVIIFKPIHFQSK